MTTRRPIPSHLPVTLFAVAVAVSVGGVAVDTRAASPAQPGPPGSSRTTPATLLERLSAAARSLMAQAERRVVRPAVHRPALRLTELRSLPHHVCDPLSPHRVPIPVHLLNLPPPLQA